MNTVTIGNRLFSQFKLIFTEEAIERLTPGPGRKGDTFAIGVVDNGLPLGAIAVKCSPPTAEVISLYVLEEFRRFGIGSTLLSEAMTRVMLLPGLSEFIVPYAELPGEDKYTSFFKGLGMDIIDVGRDYRISAKAAFESPKLQIKPRHKIVTESWESLKSGEQKLLFNEGAGLHDYFLQGKLRKDLVFVVMSEDRRSYRGCIAVVEGDDDELILAWLRAERAPFVMMELFRHVIRLLIKNGEYNKIIRIPTINPASDAMVQDLFGNKLTVNYESKRVVFDFGDENEIY